MGVNPPQTDVSCTQPGFCTAGSSIEVHGFTCQPTGQSHEGLSAQPHICRQPILTLTCGFLLDLMCELAAALPEAILPLPPAALSTSKGETHQPVLMLLVQLQAGMAAWDQAWEMLCKSALLRMSVGDHLVKACWQLLLLDNLQICAQLQVTWLPLVHGMDSSTGLLKRPLT